MRRIDGDEFVRCACGDWHWGAYGAAGLLVHHRGNGVLLQRRAAWVHHGSTWALPGGAVRADETPAQAAARETVEEADLDVARLRPVAQVTEEHHTWRYTTVLALADTPLNTRCATTESAELRWVDTAMVERFTLHHDFAAAWPVLAEQLGRQLVMIVDTATVPRELVGSLETGQQWSTDPIPLELGTVTAQHGTRHWAWWPWVVQAAGPAAVRAATGAHQSRDGVNHLMVVTADAELREWAGESGAVAANPTVMPGGDVQTWAPSSGP